MIVAVNSATQITVVPPWPNANASAQNYEVYRTTRIDTPEVLGYLQSLKAQIDGTTSIPRVTVDSGAVRGVWRDDGAGNFSAFVGNTGVADGSTIEAIEINRTTGQVRFPAASLGTLASELRLQPTRSMLSAKWLKLKLLPRIAISLR